MSYCVELYYYSYLEVLIASSTRTYYVARYERALYVRPYYY